MSTSPAPGDQVRVSVTVRLPPDAAFRVYTEQIDRWWRRGPKFRHSGASHGIIHLEPRVGGRVFESIGDGASLRVLELGRVLAWEPPHRFVHSWRNANFAPHEVTEVEVEFRAVAGGTSVTVTHRGWTALRADHPARHGLDAAAFCRMMGLWWGDLLSSLREAARASDALG